MLANKFVVGVYQSEFLYYKQHFYLGNMQILDHFQFPGAPNSEFRYTYL